MRRHPMRPGQPRPSRPRAGRSSSKARRRRRHAALPRVESLESRSLMASLIGGTLDVIDAGIPNETLDQAVLLGDLNSSPGIESHGSIGGGPAGNADVEWYSFTLAQASRVVAELT